MRRAAVLGRPVGHSLSPLLHRAAYAALGLDWTYDAVEVGAAELSAFVAGLDAQWVGLSLTMPLKEAVLPLLDDAAPLVGQVAAANTVVLSAGRLTGHNTDVHGVVAALREAGLTTARAALVLGGGATARSAIAALALLGVRRPVLAVRSEPVETLAAAARLGVQPVVVDLDDMVVGAADVVVSTLPPGAADPWADRLAGAPVLLDVAYGSEPSLLAQRCRGSVVDGTRMLLHQAAAQVELMTGRPAPVGAMDAALRRR